MKLWLQLQPWLPLLVATAILWAALFPITPLAESASQTVNAEETVKSDSSTVTDNVYGQPQLLTEAPSLISSPLAHAVIIEDFEDIGDITTSGVRTVPDSTMLELDARPGPVMYGHYAGKFSYDFTGTSGTSAAYMHFNGSSGKVLDGSPSKIGMWVYGDGNKHWLRGLLQDADSKTHYISFTEVRQFNWHGWRYVTADVPDQLPGPIKLRQVYIAELDDNNKNSGTVYFDQLSAIYHDADPVLLEISGLAGMAVGQQRQAEAFATMAGASALQQVTAGTAFVSSDPSVATVDSTGAVTAVGPGMTAISAEYAGLQASYMLSVGDSAAALLGIELMGSTHLETGAMEQLQAVAFYEGNPDGMALSPETANIAFASSDTSVATVDGNGVIIAVGEGSSIISAEWQGRSFSYGLNVTDPVPVLQSIRIADLTPLTAGESKSLRVMAAYTLLEEEVDVTAQASYTSSNPAVADVNEDGLVSAHAAGTTRIRAVFEDKLIDYLLIVFAEQLPQKRELRAAWIASVENIDWPQKGVTTEEEQKSDFRALLDELAATGINAIIVQIKPTADAFYPSSYAPWSEWLTGVQGQDPGYDPLAFMIEEAQARNMEFHAWFNPYRISMTDNWDNLVEGHPAKQHPDWVEAYGGKLYFNPGVPEAKQYVIDSVMEVVNGYDIDAVHFDDYFYPYPASGDFPDEEEYLAYRGEFDDKAAWRRNNVDSLIEALSEDIKSSKPHVKFGISPFGIWRNKGSDPSGSDTNGLQSYDALNADTKRWVEEGWLDYIAPQDYWHFGYGPAAYEKVLEWWRQVTSGRNVHLYVGQAMYRVDTSWEDPEEIYNQIKYNRSFQDDIDGSMFFSANSVLANPHGMRDRMTDELYRYPALPPTMPWIDHEAPAAPTLSAAPAADGVTLQWQDAPEDSSASYYVLYRQSGLTAPDITNPGNMVAKVRKQADSDVQTFIDTSIMPGTDYTYTVTALDRLHNESEASNAIAAPILTGIAVSGKKSLRTGQSDQLQVTGMLRGGNDIPILEGVSFSSSNSDVLAVSDSGKTTALRYGKSVITATYGSLSDQHEVDVFLPSYPGPVPSPNPDDGDDGDDGDNPDDGGTDDTGNYAEPSFKDITGHWAKQAILRAAKLGIAEGFQDGSFRPEKQVTRAEFITLLMRAFPDRGKAEGELAFADAKLIPDWAADAVRRAVKAGLINGYDDGTFRPDQPITRSEIATLAVRLLELEPVKEAKLPFSDADDAPVWAQGYIAAAVEAGIMKGRGGNRFAPGELAKRSEAVVVLLALLDNESR
ncbi:family 10 glycosylhydrolase [Paenibacillus sp. J5C_2022]|uniref:family 10 glycosylhydrolase n=1 Tax=Paenibacillus sp. J5C2022 TaxID=2977129 RepID=UPI0021D02891|nr:family 10 glycosylhydrolase [Paenibacillus sp. J5C2022]MCU6707468.1 family 10 glycosylhydrolase [Paenibacillus sp. J5C2022]